MKKAKKAALYVRVATADRMVDNQVAELERLAEFRGWEIVARYSDLGISGAKGRQERPGLETMPRTPARRGSRWSWRGA